MSCLLYIPAESSVIGDTRIYELYSLLKYTKHASTVDKINAAILFDPLGFSLGYRAERHVDEV